MNQRPPAERSQQHGGLPERPPCQRTLLPHMRRRRPRSSSRSAAAMTRAACREIRRALGAYVVGGIGPADRSAMDQHLAECADCRDELAGLAGLPGLMGRVPVDEATRLLLDGEPDERPSLVSLLGRAAQLHRHRVWPLLAAAAAVGLIA